MRQLGKLAEGGHIVQGLFHGWVAQVEPLLHEIDAGGYLFVDLMVQNAQAKEPQTIPNVELIDGNDAIYLPTAEALMLRDALRIGQSLNLFEVKIGVLVFKAPPSGTYKLRIKGESMPGIGYVALMPKPAPYGKVIELNKGRSAQVVSLRSASAGHTSALFGFCPRLIWAAEMSGTGHQQYGY